MPKRRTTRAKRSRDPEETRRALIEAAEALFAERGFHGTSTEEISRASGVNKAMISYHFGGKEGLYTAILLENLTPTLERLRGLRSGDRAAPERLREFLGIFGELHASHPRLSSMILREVLSGGRHLDDAMLPRFLEVFSILGEILGRGAREGSFRPIPPLLAHLSLMGSLVFFFATRPFRDRLAAEGRLPARPIEPEEFVAYLQDLMSRGLQPDVSAPGSSST